MTETETNYFSLITLLVSFRTKMTVPNPGIDLKKKRDYLNLFSFYFFVTAILNLKLCHFQIMIFNSCLTFSLDELRGKNCDARRLQSFTSKTQELKRPDPGKLTLQFLLNKNLISYFTEQVIG